MTTALLFDLDYTLVDYDPDYGDALAAGCEAAGVRPSLPRLTYHHERYIERQHAFEDDPMVGAARDFCAAYCLSADPVALAEEVVDATVEAAYVPDGVRETLDALAGDYPMGVVTNGYGPHQRRRLAATGLDGYFETMLSPEQVEAFKPDAAVFEEARRRLPADEYVFVGDSIDADVRAADEFGFRTVLVGDRDVDGDPADLPEVDLHVPEFGAFDRIRGLLE